MRHYFIYYRRFHSPFLLKIAFFSLLLGQYYSLLDVLLMYFSFSKRCFWRGQLGQFWDSKNCSASSDWGRWFNGYKPVVLHYARLAQTAGADAYLIAHELQVFSSLFFFSSLIKLLLALFFSTLSVKKSKYAHFLTT